MSNFKKIIISPTTKLLQAIEVIDKGKMQIALICDAEMRLLGTLSDGDIRRGILRGFSTDTTVNQVMNSEPTFVTVGTEPAVIQKLMLEKKIKHIPVVNHKKVIVGLDFDESVQEPMGNIPVVLMAGGKGERLMPLTKETPKPMLKIGDKPILEIIIENLTSCGVQDFFISVNFKSEIIKDHFKDGSSLGVKIQYLEESQPLGTAGSLKLLPKDMKKPFIVMNGDVLTRVNFKKLVDFHLEQKAVATMCLKSFQMDVPYGVVSLDGFDITQIDEKPVQKFFVNAGIYIFDPRVQKYIPEGERTDMTSLFMKLKKDGAKVIGYPLHEYWVDIGSKTELNKASTEFKS